MEHSSWTRGEGTTARGTSVSNQQQLLYHICRLSMILAEAPTTVLPDCVFPWAAKTKYNKLGSLKLPKDC